jgi:hypothetical protein
LQIFNINFEDYYLAKHVSEQLNQTWESPPESALR